MEIYGGLQIFFGMSESTELIEEGIFYYPIGYEIESYIFGYWK